VPHGAFIQVGNERKFLKEMSKPCSMKSTMKKRKAREMGRKERSNFLF
jgi:hypothetical protein